MLRYTYTHSLAALSTLSYGGILSSRNLILQSYPPLNCSSTHQPRSPPNSATVHALFRKNGLLPTVSRLVVHCKSCLPRSLLMVLVTLSSILVCSTTRILSLSYHHQPRVIRHTWKYVRHFTVFFNILSIRQLHANTSARRGPTICGIWRKVQHYSVSWEILKQTGNNVKELTGNNNSRTDECIE